jgi:hypothetical protein
MARTKVIAFPGNVTKVATSPKSSSSCILGFRATAWWVLPRTEWQLSLAVVRVGKLFRNVNRRARDKTSKTRGRRARKVWAREGR